ncbi:MAG: putative toxin-antitoxin system toxin component, PIN family [Spirochaetaceae bacterium]|jgi:putative PIN family toxin of toxin-antitoxin system|nr:putative toxin-antitoxin system toxin component, PIN family [Spirochaetaceae bacterium]
MKVVIDTNVIVSALMNTNGTPAKILSLILNGKVKILYGKVKILYDNRIIFEYIDVLSREDFGFDIEIISDIIDYIMTEGEYVNSEYMNIEFIDEADKKFYEVHKSGEAQYLITGNIKHFPKENAIIIPKSFLEIFDR